MATSLAIPVFELKLFAKLRFRKKFSLKAKANTFINLPEINNGTLTVQLVTQKPMAGQPPVPSGKADLGIFHSDIRVTKTTELKPALDGSGMAITSTTFAKSKDSLWKVYIENKKTEAEVHESFREDGEPFMLLVEYNSSYPIKTKLIPMSFWQRAFDEFWNTYRPVENIKLDYNFDLAADQLSLGAVFQLLLLVKERLAFNDTIAMAYVSQEFNIPRGLLDNTAISPILKYHSYFKGFKFYSLQGELITGLRDKFIGIIGDLSIHNIGDNELFAIHSRHTAGQIFDTFAKFFSPYSFARRQSNKVIITLKQEIAKLYNHDSHYNPVQTVTIKLPDLGYSIAGQKIASARLHDINVTRIQFATLKSSPVPGFKASFTIETGGPKEIDLDIITDSGDFDIKSLTINPQIALMSLDSVDKNSLNEWGKNYALSFRMNFEMHPNIIVEYPDISASVEFNRDDLIKLDIHAEWVKKYLNDVMNDEVSIAIGNELNKFRKRVIEYLLGEAYPIIEIKQVNDNMQITFVANPDDNAFLQINQPSPYKPPATNNLSKIDHIVVLMMENRSFDQMLGYLKVLEGRKDVDGLKGDEFNTYTDRFSNSNKKYQVFHSTKTDIYDDPCHAFDCMADQIGTNMNGFVYSMTKKFTENKVDSTKPAEVENYYKRLLNVMRYYGKVELPTNDFIANEYAICDKWFCSHPGQTQPNRFISYTGKLNKNAKGEIEVDNPDFGTFNPVETYTILDYLTQCKVSWKVFEHGYSLARMFAKNTFDITNVIDYNNLNFGFKASLKNIPGNNKTNFPSVAFIEPDYIDVPPGADDHPPSDVKNGQKFIASVIKDLQQSGIWEKCVLIITYDESGGFYDHVLPPNNAIPLKGGVTRYGPRVPSFVISPYVAAKTVSHELYDHTSILAAIIRRFIRPELHEKLDLGPRIKSANDIGSLLSLEEPRKNVRQIDIPSYPVAIPPNYKMSLPTLLNSDFHELLFGFRLIMGYPPK